MPKSKCSGCEFWVWHERDRLYDSPGGHACTNKDQGLIPCAKYPQANGTKLIKRGQGGFITDACLDDMTRSLPIEVFVGYENTPHKTISNIRELEDFLFGHTAHSIVTRYRKK